MDVLQKVLALRPTNAASKLGSASELPLLNPRDLLKAQAQKPGALLCVDVPAPSILPGVLRAARDEDAPVGLAASHRPSQRDAPSQFFDAVRDAAQETSHRRPVFLQAGPVRVTSGDPRSLELLAGDLFRYVDAGFTLLSLDLSALAPEQAAAAAAELVRPAAERELSVELTLPAGPLSRDAAASHLEALGAQGVRPGFLRIRSSAVVPEAAVPGMELEPDFELLRDLCAIATEHGAALSLEDAGSPRRLLSAWAAAGIRKVDVGGPFARLVLRCLPASLREGLEQRARSSGVPLHELLAQLGDPLESSPGERERAEALAYGEAGELLAMVGASGTATQAMEFLAQKSGY